MGENLDKERLGAGLVLVVETGAKHEVGSFRTDLGAKLGIEDGRRVRMIRRILRQILGLVLRLVAALLGLVSDCCTI